MHNVPELCGLVLAGGLSRRMGTDKGLIHYYAKPQREHLFELLQEVCGEVFISCRAGQDVPVSLNPIVDSFAIESPLNGILTALSIYPQKAWMAVAVDLPNVTGEVLHTLRGHRAPGKFATCFFDDNAEAPEPLLAIWEPAARPLVLASVSEGNISPRSFLQSHEVEVLRGMHPSVFLNINDPGARGRWQQKGDSGDTTKRG